MKKLSVLLLKSYIGPFIITFVVAMFIFEMQFVWVYLDDLMGKGLGPLVILELLTYASARIVNMALPLAILMSSIMTFGALSENNELTAMKSAGGSLFRIMRPLVVFTLALAVSAFFFANNIWPIANLKFRTLLYSIVQQRPALNLENGVFYNGIEGISIRVREKDKETNALTDVLIYDHRDKLRGNRTVIRAASGQMEQTDDKRFLVLTLFDGHTYDEQEEKKKKEKDYPLIRSDFGKMVLRLDLSSFAFQNNNEDIFRNSYEMMTVPQLDQAIDSLQVRLDSLRLSQGELSLKAYHVRDTTVAVSDSTTWFFDALSSGDKAKAISAAREATRRSRDVLDRQREEVQGREKYITRHKIEWHRKFILGVACIVLFFIGAPLGAIIRKGGLGLPTVIALSLFIVYQLLTIAGEKMAKSGIVDPWIGLWMSTVLMMPLSIWLTYKASREAVLFDADAWKRLFSLRTFRRLFERRNSSPSPEHV